MPNMDGLETIIEMRRTHPETKILAKPLTFSTFGAAVERLLGQSDRPASPFAENG
ncbi:MAG: hypothetical protein K0M78_09495 [Brevundimonas sp.]|nr:hypothetical protein [Brevundimonas sp.]